MPPDRSHPGCPVRNSEDPEMDSVVQHDERRRRLLMLRQVHQTTVAGEPSEETAGPQLLREPDLPRSALEQFRRDCGMRSSYLIRVACSESGSQPQTLLWDRPWLIVGRSEECDLHLPHAEVSRKHAYLQVVRGRVCCLDLGSRTGTHWMHGGNANQAGPVDAGEPVSIGPYSLTLEETDGGLEEADPPPDDEEAPLEMHLDFLNVGDDVRRWTASRSLILIGQSEPCKVRLGDASVSRVHCGIVRTPRRLWVVDLLSDEGTLVEGRAVAAARLDNGSELQVGRYRIGVCCRPKEEDEDSSIHISPQGSSTGRPPVELSPEDDAVPGLRRIGKGVSAQHDTPSANGTTERLVLNVIKEMGTMQQQALQQMRESMSEAINTLSSSYQRRIEELERRHNELHSQLRRLPSPAPTATEGPPEFSKGGADRPSEMSPPPSYRDLGDFPQEDPLPAGEPEHGSYQCDDPKLREAVLREQMKFIESEIDRTQKGWGKKLMDLLGH